MGADPPLAYDSAVLQPVLIEKVKRPQGRGLWGAYETAADSRGRWLFTPRGSLYQGGTGVDAAYCNVGSSTGPGIPVVQLIASRAWWIATFWEPGETAWSVTFDVSTPPSFAAGCWSYIDLELDVVVTSRGELMIEDQWEFDAACRAGWISDDEARCARSAVEQIRSLVGLDSGFVAAGLARLAEADALGLRPLRDLATS